MFHMRILVATLFASLVMAQPVPIPPQSQTQISVVSLAATSLNMLTFTSTTPDLTKLQQVTQVVSDALGVADISKVQFVVTSTDPNVANAGCHVRWDNTAHVFNLLNDAGSAWGPNLPAFSVMSDHNSRCYIFGGGFASASGNNLTVTFLIGFYPAFAGDYLIYGFARDNTNTISTFYLAGGVLTLSNSNPGMFLNGVAPINGTSTPHCPSPTTPIPFGVAGTSTQGPSGFDKLQLLFIDGSVLATPGGGTWNAYSCTVRYDPTTRGFSLLNDTSDAWGVPMLAGSGQSQSNSQCILYASGSSASTNNTGSSISAIFNIAFQCGWKGRTLLEGGYGRNADVSLDTGYVTQGTWGI